MLDRGDSVWTHLNTGDRMNENQVKDIFTVFRKWSPKLTKEVLACAQYKKIYTSRRGIL
jgi:hypothetical protein